MNSKIFALTVAALVGLSASADVLYWQVNDAAQSGTDLKGTPAQAYLMATPTTGSNPSAPFYVSSNLDEGGNDLGDAVGMGTFANGGTAAGVLDLAKILSWSDGTTSASSAGISGFSDLSFFVELYDASGNWVGQTTPQTYDSLVSSGAISSGLNPNFSGVNSAVGGGSGSYSVPEPTSGLLMLVGLGALALRRKRA